MKLLLDQGLPRSACATLREFGHEVVHVGDVGMSRASDADILVRVPGFGSQQLCLLIQSVVETCGEALATGAAVSADEESARVRRLPIA